MNRTISIAPMMDYTDRHCRYFFRLLSKHCLLYTEMITSGAIIHGDRARLLQYDPIEHPVAFQVGSSNPTELIECAKIIEDLGYDEINLNVGCPSERVQSGAFGLCLMHEPDLVAECIAKMISAVTIPVTVKTRTGVDEKDSYPELKQFIQTVAQTSCDTFIIHARKGWLKGLSPKENRTVPPLQYDRVYQLKQDFPELSISINGGVQTLEKCHEHLTQVDGVMLGRAAYHTPYLLAEVDQQFYQSQAPIPTRVEVIEQLIPYIEQQARIGIPLKHITRHILGLFQGQPGAKRWRRFLSENAHLPEATAQTLKQSLAALAPSS